ncbi:MAG: ECF transporter S component [Erysipelotrichaceae bacterium]
MNNEKIRKLAVMSLMVAIVVVLQYIGSFIKLGEFSISLVLVPIVIGAALYGPLSGALLGFVFGLIVLLSGDAAAFMAYSPLATVIVVLVKGVAAGFVSGLVYKAISKKSEKLAGVVASLSAPIVNTGVFLIGCVLVYMPLITSWAGDAGYGSNIAGYFIYGLVVANFVVEMLINAALATTIVRLIKVARK